MLKNKFYTALKIVLYCLLAVSVIICIRAVVLSFNAALTDDEKLPAVICAIVSFYVFLHYAPLPAAVVDMLYCVRYFESDKKTTAKTVANCFFILLSLGMIVSTVLMILGKANTNSPIIILIYLALRLSYIAAVRIQKQS